MLLRKHGRQLRPSLAPLCSLLPSSLGLLQASNPITTLHLLPKQRPVLSTMGAVIVSATMQPQASTAAAPWASCCSRTGRPAKVRALRGQEHRGKGLRLGPEIHYLLQELLKAVLIIKN